MVGADSIACVVVEPIAGEGGFVVPKPGWLAALAGWCSDNGIVLVADEVQTGMGRTGAWFACEHEGVIPDIVATAKSLGGGLPVGGVTGRADLMDAVHVGGLGGTFGGNPLACAAALAVFDMIESEQLLARAVHIGEVALPRLQKLVSPGGPVGHVRGRGAMIALELLAPTATNPTARRPNRSWRHAIRGASSCSALAPMATSSACCPHWSLPTTSSKRASTFWKQHWAKLAEGTPRRGRPNALPCPREHSRLPGLCHTMRRT